MKLHTIRSLIAAAALAAAGLGAHAATGDVLVQQGFENISTLASQGWTLANHGTAGGLTPDWFQGDVGVDQTGALGSFIATNYNAVPAGGILFSLLATPVVDASLGLTASFWTRTDPSGVDQYSDHLAWGFTTGNPLTDPLVASGVAIVSGEWTQHIAYLYASPSVTTASFWLQYGGNADTSNYLAIDTLTILSGVPEAPTSLMLGAGLLGLGALRRRAAKSQA